MSKSEPIKKKVSPIAVLFNLVGLLCALGITYIFCRAAWENGFKVISGLVGVAGFVYACLLGATGSRSENVHSFFRLVPALIYGSLLFASTTFGTKPEPVKYETVKSEKKWEDASFSIEGIAPKMHLTKVERLLGEPTGKTWTNHVKISYFRSIQCDELADLIDADEPEGPVFVGADDQDASQYRKVLADYYGEEGIPPLGWGADSSLRRKDFEGKFRLRNCVVTTVPPGQKSEALKEALEKLIASGEDLIYFVRLRDPEHKIYQGSERYYGELWTIKRYPLLTYKKDGVALDYIEGTSHVDSVHGDSLFYKTRELFKVGEPMPALPPDWPRPLKAANFRFRAEPEKLGAPAEIANLKVGKYLVQVYLEDDKIYKTAVFSRDL